MFLIKFQEYFEKMYSCSGVFTEAALQMWPSEELFWKYAVNLQENTHAEVRFQ